MQPSSIWLKRAALLLTLVLPLAAHAEIIDIKWTDKSFSHDAAIAPKKFLEICGALKKSERVSWAFDGSLPSDFNVHHHVGKKVIYAEDRKAISRAEGQLIVAQDETYCWMWTNKSDSALTVKVNLKQLPLSASALK